MDETPGNSLFQPGNLHIENDFQNLEEAEDIEDQKRLQGEMQNLFTNALYEFNYDEQSTLNSSANISLEESNDGSSKLASKYKNASLDDQLKVLYDARVREVKSLQERMEKQKIEFEKQRDDIKKKHLLSEANRDKAEISLTQSTELLVDKTARLTNVSLELKELQKSFENLQMKQLELLEENAVLKNINEDILEQKDMILKGFNKSSVSDRMLEEKYNQEIKQLRIHLEGLSSRLDRKEQENAELSQLYKKLDKEKDDLMIQKCSHINSLSEHLQSAQKQCRDLIKVMEQLTEENDRLKKSPNNISESIRIIGLKDQSDMINALHKELEKTKESQRKQLAQFEQLQKQSSEKVKECNRLKGELELVHKERKKDSKEKFDKSKFDSSYNFIDKSIYKEKENECTNLKEELAKVHNELNFLKNRDNSKMDCINNFIDESIYNEQMKILQDENNLLNDKISNLEEEIELLKKLENANLELVNKVNLLETQIKSQARKSGNCIINSSEYIDLEKEKLNFQQDLEVAKTTIQKLENTILEYQNQFEALEIKVKLQGEREVLIENLQEKATQFESYLQQQKELEEHMISIGINTENVVEKSQLSFDNEELIKEKYEAELINKEIDMRQALQKEFTDKWERYAQEITEKVKSISPNKSIDSCRKCERKEHKLFEMETALTTSIQQIKKISQERTDDREAISTLLTQWKQNFEDIEKQKNILTYKLVNFESRNQELEHLLQLRDNGDAKLLEKLKREVEAAIQNYNKKVLTDVSNMAENQLKVVTDVHRKIDEITISTEKQISDIEKKFINTVKSYCVKQKSLKKKSAK